MNFLRNNILTFSFLLRLAPVLLQIYFIANNVSNSAKITGTYSEQGANTIERDGHY